MSRSPPLDDLGQLIREDNEELGYTYAYTYDDAGNIICKKKYDYTSGSLSGSSLITTYTRSFSGDKLTDVTSEDYDGMYISIEYDAVGNPIRMWEDGFDMYGYALEWEGRQLVSVSNVWDDGELDTFLEFTYNADGIRTSKTYNGVKHDYFLNGSQVIAETWTQNNVEHLLLYLYDENSSPLGLKYRNSTYSEGTFDCYFFEKNLQGDIVAVYDDTGYRIGKYVYDAWGRCTVVCNSYGLDKTVVESYNPFRYRGYFYDVETKMYYLQSRYYSPDMGRFFNGDGYVSTGQGLLGNNMFAYCSNNPVNEVDYLGNKPGDLFDTPDEAAIDFARYYNAKSINKKQERGKNKMKKNLLRNICIIETVILLVLIISSIFQSFLVSNPESADLKEFISTFTEENNYFPEVGYVPDASTAKAIGSRIIDNLAQHKGFGITTVTYDQENRLWLVDKGYLFSRGGFVIIEQDSGKVIKALLSK